MKTLLIFLVVFCNSGFAQFNINVSVIDETTEEPVSNVKVIIKPGDITGVTGEDGKYSNAKVSVQSIKISLSRIGYKEFSKSIDLESSSENYFNFKLTQSEIMSGEIKVYSSKFENQLKYAILPVSLITEKDFSYLPAVSSADIMKTKPGINLVRDGIWANDVNIRGLSRDNVVVYINGNRVETANNHAARFALIDKNSIERIEIIKGGVSSIYGSGATGGIVNIKTRTGDFSKNLKFTGNASGEYYSVNKLSDIGMSLYYSSDKVNANLYTTYREATDTKSPDGIIPNSSFRDYGVAFNTGVKLWKNHSINFEYQKYKTPYAGIPGGYPLFPVNAKVTYIPADRDLFSVNYDIKHVSKIMIKLSARLFFQNILRDVEVFPNSSVFIPASGNTLATRIENLSIYPSGKHYSKGLLIQSDIQKGDNKLVLGIDAWQRELNTTRERTQQIYKYDSLGNLISSANLVTGDIPIPDSRYTSIGIYANDEISLLKDKVYVNIGGRADFINVSNDESVNPLYTIKDGVRNNNPPGQDVLWSASDRNEVSWSFNGGTNYKIYEQLNLSCNFSASFRSPTLEERYQYIDLGSVVRIGNPDLQPELGYFTSAAAKYWGDNTNFSLELFSNFLTDLVSEIPGTYEGRQALIKTNIGKARLAGFESEWEINFYKRFVFYGGISFVNGENTEDNSALPQIPPLNGTLGLKFSFGKILSLNFNTIFFDSQDRVAEGEFETPGYTVYNFYSEFNNIDLLTAKLSFSAGIENIFDKNYRDHLSTSRGSFVSDPGRNIFIKTKIGF